MRDTAQVWTTPEFSPWYNGNSLQMMVVIAVIAIFAYIAMNGGIGRRK